MFILQERFYDDFISKDLFGGGLQRSGRQKEEMN